MIRLLSGDCRDVLATLPAESVHTVVTSPPYYGLRDYGTALWDGGDAACDHKPNTRMRHHKTGLINSAEYCAMPFGVYRDTCGKCCAVRVDRQIGLEATPDEYLATMVGVFREVRRVLRRDGVCFVNMGDSYASGGMSPNQSQPPSRVLACDSGGIEPAGSSVLGSVCPDLCGECRGSLLSHSVHRIDLLEAVLRRENADGHQPCDVPRVVPVSTMRRSSQQSQAWNSVVSSQGARCLLCARSLADDALASAHMAECKPGSELSGSASRNQDTDVSGWALPSHTTASHRYKPKDLLMMPARLALALQSDGWWVRSDIIWHKPNPMPESCRDRPTSAHEHVFLLTKAARYFYDAEAVRERQDEPTRMAASFRDGGVYTNDRSRNNSADADKQTHGDGLMASGRNLRNVWSIATHAYSAAHFATFPPELAERCIRAGTRPGDTVLDPFIGAGTTALVADRLQRDCIGIDLNTQYTRMAMDRCVADAPLFTSFPPAEDPEDERMADLFTDMAAD